MTEIKTGDDFKRSFPELGILPSHALAAVRQPATQHLIAIDGEAIIGLYLAPDTYINGAFMLSVVSIVSGHLSMGFRFYDDIHPDPTAIELIEILKLIVDRFGVEFTLAGQRTKFLLYDKILLRKKPSAADLAPANHPKKGLYQMVVKVQETKNKRFPFTVSCALCFGIDTDTYSAYLQSHRLGAP